MSLEDFFNDPMAALDQMIPDYFAFDLNHDSIPDMEFRCTDGSPIPTQFAFNFDSDRAAEGIVEISMGIDGSLVTSLKADLSGDNKFDFGLSDQDGDLWPDLMAVDLNQDGNVNLLLPTSDRGMLATDFGMGSGLQGWVEVDEHMTQLPAEPDHMGQLIYGEYEQTTPHLHYSSPLMASQEADIQSQWESKWHQQQSNSSCAVCCQEFILDQALGRDVSEKELVEVGMQLGVYSPLGTAPVDVGRLLDYYGVPNDLHAHSDVYEMLDYVRNGHGVIAMVDSNEIWGYPELTDLRGIPLSGANHAVQVLGVESQNGQTNVILNDPGTPDGRGMRVPLETFVDAWNDSSKTTCITRSPIVA